MAETTTLAEVEAHARSLAALCDHALKVEQSLVAARNAVNGAHGALCAAAVTRWEQEGRPEKPLVFLNAVTIEPPHLPDARPHVRLTGDLLAKMRAVRAA